MGMIWIVLILICILTEAVLVFIGIKKNKKKREKMKRSLYKMIEERVLEQSLRYRITNTEAAIRESNSPFLYIEFLDTDPMVTYLFPLDEWITVGRSKENKICVYDEKFSRVHCKIGMVNQTLWIQDMDSANGVRIYKGLFKKLDLIRGQHEMLQSGNCIKIGSCRMKLEIVYGFEAIY